MFACIKIASSAKQPILALRFAELCLRKDPKHLERHVAIFYQDSINILKVSKQQIIVMN